MTTAVLSPKKTAAKPRRTNRTKAKAKPESKSTVKKPSVHEQIADRIIELLDMGELPPWEKGWNASSDGEDQNPVSKTHYKGVNRWLTLMTRLKCGYQDPRWLTFKQAKQTGGSVRKHEKGTQVVFWKPPDENGKNEEEQDSLISLETEKSARRANSGCFAPTPCST